jgi:hypothetical protein
MAKKAAKGGAAGFRGPKDAVPYLEALYGAGLIQVTTRGTVSLDPDVADLVKAIHVVLAGGKVSVKARGKGNAAIARDLDRKLARAVKSASLLKGDLGPGTYAP